MTSLRTALVAIVLLAGCAAPAVTETSSTASGTLAPSPGLPPVPAPPAIPACSLQDEPLLVPDAPGAPRPSQPVSLDGRLQATFRTTPDGTTHIYADDAYTLYYANGYAQARDRLFEMDLLRHIALGDSAILLGSGQLPSDFRVTRDLYTPAEVLQQYQDLPDPMREVLDAFAAGVSRYITEAASDAQMLPGEYVLLDTAPQPWHATDTVAILDYLLGTYGASGARELDNAQRLAQLQSTLGEAEAVHAFDDMLWARADHTYTTIPPTQRAVNGCEDLVHAAPGSEQARLARLAVFANETSIVPTGAPVVAPPVPPFERTLGPGSLSPLGGLGVLAGFQFDGMAIAVDGNHSATGKPLLLGGAQTGYQKPPVLYALGLHGAGWDVAGVGFAGVPGVFMGRNAQFAWTVTAGQDDQTDVVAVEVGGETGTDPEAYLWDGEAKQMVCTDTLHSTQANVESIFVEGFTGPPVRYFPQRSCRLESGWPIIARTGPDAPKQLAWAMRSAARGTEAKAAWMWFNVGRQDTLEQARAMLDAFPLSFNFAFADGARIAMLHTGAIPLRSDAVDRRLPLPPGDANQWHGIARTRGLGLWDESPAQGYYVNWDNAPAYGWRTGDTPQMWGSVHRAETLDALVRTHLAQGNLTFLGLQAIEREAATRDPFAGHFVPSLVQAARSHSGMGDLATELQSWRDAGLPWREGVVDDEPVYTDPAHAIYDRAMAELVRRIEVDELAGSTPTLRLDPRQGADAHAGDHGRAMAEYSTLADALAGRTRHDWCDDNATRQHETCQEDLVSSLRLAQSTLTRDHSADPKDWLQPAHRANIVPLGATRGESIPMVDRGAWVQVVALDQGAAGAAQIIAPSNLGHIGPSDVSLGLIPDASEEPPGLRQSLDKYMGFGYDTFALTRSEVDHLGPRTGTLTVLPLPVAPPNVTVPPL